MNTYAARRELSSRFTPVYRWVLPGLLTLIAIGAIFWGTLTADGHPARIALAVAVAGISMLVARWLDRAKRVWLDSSRLYVSDYRRATQISLAEISAVKATKFVRPTRITVWFSRPTIFGDRIAFFPARATRDALVNQVGTNTDINTQKTGD